MALVCGACKVVSGCEPVVCASAETDAVASNSNAASQANGALIFSCFMIPLPLRFIDSVYPVRGMPAASLRHRPGNSDADRPLVARVPVDSDRVGEQFSAGRPPPAAA